MVIGLIVLFIIVVFLILRHKLKKQKDTSETQLSVLEHPSTFKKPEIEMVTKPKEVVKTDEKLKSISFTKSKE